MTITIRLKRKTRRKLARFFTWTLAILVVAAAAAVNAGEVIAFLGLATAATSLVVPTFRLWFPRAVTVRMPRQQVRRPRTRKELGA